MSMTESFYWWVLLCSLMTLTLIIELMWRAKAIVNKTANTTVFIYLGLVGLIWANSVALAAHKAINRALPNDHDP